MKFDFVHHGTLDHVAAAARHAEDCGLHGLWSLDTGHNPFLPLLLAAEHTRSLQIGTGVAVALARSPMTLAQEAWDLAGYSGGRFILGLGSQVEPHIVRRFAMRWEKPVEQMREMVLALRTIWNAFQTGDRLKFEGEHYRLSLLTPFFNPGPIAHPDVPIVLAGVGPRMTELAGEVADGFMLHPFSNRAYFESTTRPALELGLERAGRKRSEFQVVAPVFIVTGDDRVRSELEAKVREQIGFYGSTPAYQGVLEAIGYGELHRELHRLSRNHGWSKMAEVIPDELVDAFAVRAPLDRLAASLLARFGGLYDRVVSHFPVPDTDAELIRTMVETLERSPART